MYENFHLRRRSKTRENMVTIIKNYIMIEEKPMEIALATDNPYEVLEQAKI